MKTIIVSDVHLSLPHCDTESDLAFLSFLRKLTSRDVERIIIVGDLFHCWFEKPRLFLKGYFPALSLFAKLHDQGVDIDFICGNHDFTAGHFLQSKTGFKIHRNELRTQLGEKRVLLAHGDGRNSEAWRYRISHRILRGPIVMCLLRCLPLWFLLLGARLVNGLNEMKMRRAESRGNPVAVGLRHYAKEFLEKEAEEAEDPIRVVILGHCHRKEDVEVETARGGGRYLNVGAWEKDRSYIEFDGRDLTLREYAVGGNSQESQSTGS